MDLSNSSRGSWLKAFLQCVEPVGSSLSNKPSKVEKLTTFFFHLGQKTKRALALKWQSNEVFTMDEAQSMELQKGSSHPSASPNANLSATTITIQKWLEKLRKERKKKGYLGDSINGKTNNSSVESCGNQLWCLANNSWVLKVTVCIKQFHHPSNYASLSLFLSLFDSVHQVHSFFLD